MTFDPELGFDIDEALAEMIRDGQVEVVVRGITQEATRFRLTKKGEELAQQVFRENGVDPHDKAAVERFLYGKRRK